MDNAHPGRPLPPPSRRRDKPQIVCNSCRRGKLKCDRAQPCGNCARRGLAYACAYANASNAPSRSVTVAPMETDLSERVKQLEKLVMSMIPNPMVNETMDLDPKDLTPSQTLIQEPEALHEENFNLPIDVVKKPTSMPPGLIKQDDVTKTYVGSTHWTAILDEISEIKEAIGNMHTQRKRFLFAATVPDLDGTDVIFGYYPRLNKQQLIAAMPPRATVDTLVKEYFNNKCIDSVIIHKPSFFAEYERFWEKPIGTGSHIIWIAMLYAMGSLAACYIEQPTPLLPDPKRVIQSHAEKVIQALVLGKYDSTPRFTVETLIIFLQVQILQNQDGDINISLLLAIITKLAARQGYHRDASHFPHLSALDGEMMRRVWLVILQLDAQTAISNGLPRTIRTPFYDTAEPKNLLDNDFHTDDEMLPLARAETVPTPVQFLIMKNRLLAVHGSISDLANSVAPVGYNEVMGLDMSLHNAYASVPLGLRMYPLTANGEIKISYDVVIKRIYIALIFEDARCVLHQRFMHHALADHFNAQYANSLTTCIEAALEILSYQHLLEVETRPEGRLHQERWRIDRMSRNNFLFASSVLSLYLNAFARGDTDQSAEQAMRQGVVTALKEAHEIWSRIELCESSVDAAKAAKAIEFVLSAAQEGSTHAAPGKGIVSSLTTPETPQQATNKLTGLASIHSLLMQNSGVDYTGISARHGGG